MALILGIDPGVNGGLALMAGDGELLATAGMPSVVPPPESAAAVKRAAAAKRKKQGGSQQRRIDAKAMAAIVCGWRETYGPIGLAVVERIHGDSRWGAVNFAFGRALGCIEGTLLMLGMTVEVVGSREWRNEVIPKAREGKGDVVAWFKLSYPGVKRLAPRQAQREGIADAAAIAEFWRRKGGNGREVA